MILVVVLQLKKNYLTLSNKFTQDVMSDTYGIPAGTLVKRVRGLMKFGEGENEMDPHYPITR